MPTATTRVRVRGGRLRTAILSLFNATIRRPEVGCVPTVAPRPGFHPRRPPGSFATPLTAEETRLLDRMQSWAERTTGRGDSGGKGVVQPVGADLEFEAGQGRVGGRCCIWSARGVLKP
jgi:hypothetical protein